MVPGVLETAPLPTTAAVRVVVERLNCALMLVVADIVSVQVFEVPALKQSPPHPTKVEVGESGVSVNVTVEVAE